MPGNGSTGLPTAIRWPPPLRSNRDENDGLTGEPAPIEPSRARMNVSDSNQGTALRIAQAYTAFDGRPGRLAHAGVQAGLSRLRAGAFRIFWRLLR